MKVIHGTYKGLGSTVKLGLGFKPDFVRIRRVGDSAMLTLEWERGMARSATGAGGIYRAAVGDAPGFALLAANAGVRPYFGGDVVTSASLATQIGKNAVEEYRGDLKGDITQWTLDNSGNRTGHFDAALDTNLCGVGSIVQIDGVMATILALSNSGASANEVTLDRAVSTGKVQHISYQYDFAPAPVKTRMPAGMEILDTSYVNVQNEIYAITAGEFGPIGG